MGCSSSKEVAQNGRAAPRQQHQTPSHEVAAHQIWRGVVLEQPRLNLQLWRHHLTSRHISTGILEDFVRMSFQLMSNGDDEVNWRWFKTFGYKVVEASYEFLALDVLKENAITVRGIQKFLALRKGPLDTTAGGFDGMAEILHAALSEHGARPDGSLSIEQFVRVYPKVHQFKSFLRLDAAKQGFITSDQFAGDYVTQAHPNVIQAAFERIASSPASGQASFSDVLKAELVFKGLTIWRSVADEKVDRLGPSHTNNVFAYYGGLKIPKSGVSFHALVEALNQADQEQMEAERAMREQMTADKKL